MIQEESELNNPEYGQWPSVEDEEESESNATTNPADDYSNFGTQQQLQLHLETTMMSTTTRKQQ